MESQTVSSVHKQDGTYIAFDREDNRIASAGALNIHGEPVTLSPDGMIRFGGDSVARENPHMHTDGVLFIERQ